LLRRLMVNGATYCSLLRGVQMNCTAWVDYSNALCDGRWKTERVKNVRLCHCITLPMDAVVRCFVCKKPKVKFMHNKHTNVHFLYPQRPILSPPKIFTFPTASPCIYVTTYSIPSCTVNANFSSFTFHNN
jgi:hypothetical protein